MDPKPDIILLGLEIKKTHAIILNEDGEFYLSPCDEEDNSDLLLFLNGEKVTEKIRVRNKDRLIVGLGTSFLFHIPLDD